MGCVEVTLSDGIAEVRLNRPARKNAFSLEMFDALAAAGEGLKTVPDLRVVILYGAGGDFCSGLDLDVMQSLAGQVDEMRVRLLTPAPGEVANWFQKPVCVWQELRVPVIAAVDGVCLGAGIQLALAADLRLCRPDARLSVMEAKWGLIPDMGLSQSLPKLMRADHAKELMMTARMMSGTEAEALGLVTRLASDPLAAARDLAMELAANSPEAINGIKTLVYRVWTLPQGEGLAVEAEIQAMILGSANQTEAVRANMETRQAVFK